MDFSRHVVRRVRERLYVAWRLKHSRLCAKHALAASQSGRIRSSGRQSAVPLPAGVEQAGGSAFARCGGIPPGPGLVARASRPATHGGSLGPTRVVAWPTWQETRCGAWNLGCSVSHSLVCEAATTVSFADRLRPAGARVGNTCEACTKQKRCACHLCCAVPEEGGERETSR